MPPGRNLHVPWPVCAIEMRRCPGCECLQEPMPSIGIPCLFHAFNRHFLLRVIITTIPLNHYHLQRSMQRITVQSTPLTSLERRQYSDCEQTLPYKSEAISLRKSLYLQGVGGPGMPVQDEPLLNSLDSCNARLQQRTAL
jgi:hypothetical protein